MRVRETKDIYDKDCIVFPKSAKINDVQDWLIDNGYQGYKFATIIDLSRDEFHEIDEIVFNFFHDLADEAIEESGSYRAVSNWEWRKIQEQLQELKRLKGET